MILEGYMIPSLDLKKTINRKSFIKMLKVYDTPSSNKLWDYVFAEVLYKTETNGTEIIEVHLCRLNSNPYRETVFRGYASSVFPSKEISLVSLTNDSLIIYDATYRGRKLGSWAMNEIVKWAKNWPEAEVNLIKLSNVDADNKIRRNKFYENFGIIFEYYDSRKESGRSLPMKCIDLKNHESWEKKNGGHIEELPLDFFIKDIIKSNELINERNRIIEKENSELKLSYLKKTIRSLKDKLTSR